MAKIDFGNGVTVTTYPQREGFDPLKATPAAMKHFGFPSVPNNPRHMERFRKVLASLNGKFHYVEPTFRMNAEKQHRPMHKAAKGEVAGSESSGNWSGGVVYAPPGDSFHWVEGDWVVPNVDAPTQNQWYYCASWIGIDGDGSGDVCQAGVECEVYQSGTNLVRNIYPWWEWYPAGEVQITNLAVSAGDMVTMLICTGQSAGSTTATIFYSNRTNGQSTSFTITAPSGTTLVGNCAEWVVEAPTVGGSQSAIADYGQVFFNVCEAETKNNVLVNGGTGNNINMTAGGKTVSQGTLITPTVVECQYVGALP